MILYNADDSIIACSTSTMSNAAIALIRISGFSDISLFQNFFSLNLCKISPRKVYFTKLVDQGETFETACVTFFKAPHSYNGENILELSVHGNMLNVENIINLFVKNNIARLANPGEFTYRALKNKKLTLAQVEGLDLLLNANSNYSFKQGNSLLNGDLLNLYDELHRLYISHKSSLELMIDFSDDVGEEHANSLFNSTLNDLDKILTKLNSRASHSNINLLEPAIALFGLPNAGKSTIFNHLLHNERSIVSSIPGTTRDYISETYKINGAYFKLIDTAGIRESSDEIEAIGVKNALLQLNNAFFKILVVNPIDDFKTLSSILNTSFDLVIYTHSDRSQFITRQELVSKFLNAPIGPELFFPSASFELSLNEFVNKKYLKTVDQSPILLDRHKSLILKAFSLLSSYKSLVKCEKDAAVLSSELNSIGDCISELIGIISPDEILNNIFQNFCIGK
jgi:tRNA modification GTPase